VKDNYIGGYWIIANIQGRKLLQNTLYHQRWGDNTTRAAEVITLLELLKVIEKKSRYILNRKIKIGFDNKKGYNKIVNRIYKLNVYVQEAGAEVVMIKKVLKKIKFDIEISLEKGHDNQIGP